jgi:hypothetical protein
VGTSLPPVQVRFQAEGVPQVTAAFTQVQGQATRTGATINRSFVQANGQVSSFGRNSVQAFNAAGFAASQFAASGTTGFRSLASATAGFASFFGPGGLIASGVISLGLVLGDFWQRQRKEINETKDVMEKLGSAATARRARDEPVAVAGEQLTIAQRGVKAETDRLAKLLATPQQQVTSGTRALIADAELRVADALRKELEALRQVNDAQKQKTEGDNKEVTTLAAAISARQANNSQLQRATVLMGQARFVIEATKNASVEDTATMQARTKAIETLTTLTAAFNRTTAGTSKSTNDTARALELEIDALVQLGRQNQLSVADLSRLIDLQEQFTKAVRDGTLSLEQRAVASKRLSETDRGIMIPEIKVGDITETRTQGAPGPATTLPAPKIPPVAPPDVTPITNTFGDAFSQSLQAGLASGVTSFLATGSIEGLWNSIGGSIVAGMSAINPWLGVAGGILQGLIGGLLGGGGNNNRPRALPVDIRRVISDPNARAPRFAMSPGPAINVIGYNTARGQRLIGTSNRNFGRRGGR